MRVNTITRYSVAIFSSVMIGIVGMGVPLIISFILFGQSGMNQEMEDACNILMGVLGGPIVVILTRKYYKINCRDLYEVDLFSKRGMKKSLLGVKIGLVLPTLLFLLFVLSGGEVSVGSSVNWINIFSGISTFIGMAILEECIFRGILKSVFEKHGRGVSVVIPSLLFVAAHTDIWMNFNLLNVIELFVAGVLFGVIAIQSKSLTCVVVAHALYNSLSNLLYGIDSSGSIIKTSSPATIFELSGELVTKIMFIVVLIAFIIIILILEKNQSAMNNIQSKKHNDLRMV